jgi:hypothetical protein
MKWTVHPEQGAEFAEYHESDAGRVERTPSGWDAWVYIPEKLRFGHATKHKVGECYTTAVSARGAVIRAWKKYAPLNEGVA